MLHKRLEGQKRAEEREAVRCAARRLCAFGVLVDGATANDAAKSRVAKGKGKGKVEADEEGGHERRRKCEAVMSGSVVEASYAKGEWGVRWRE